MLSSTTCCLGMMWGHSMFAALSIPIKHMHPHCGRLQLCIQTPFWGQSLLQLRSIPVSTSTAVKINPHTGIIFTFRHGQSFTIGIDSPNYESHHECTHRILAIIILILISSGSSACCRLCSLRTSTAVRNHAPHWQHSSLFQSICMRSFADGSGLSFHPRLHQGAAPAAGCAAWPRAHLPLSRSLPPLAALPSPPL